MLDFLKISTKSTKNGVIEIFPKFKIDKTNDLMIRGGDFYAIWDEEARLWKTDEQEAVRLIDKELDKFKAENETKFVDTRIKVLYMWDADSGMIDKWHKYCQRQMRDSYHMLDEKLIFGNIDIKKTDYASKVLPYDFFEGETPAYDELMSVLYSDEERHKIEWAIGSIISGDSKKIQKFIVLYGAAGTGKSTVLNIIQKLFDGYYSVFDAKALGSSSNSFALEAFRSNPLVAIQHDGDLSRIEDNTRLNSLVSHELMTVNEKFKATYTNKFKAFLFMGTNKPVKITDAKSGLLRRLIDVTPTGQKIETAKYKQLVKDINFELGAIAQHCLEVYQANPGAYDAYIPTSMMGASNDFYNFVYDSFDVFKQQEFVTLAQAWTMYRDYIEYAKVQYPLSQRPFMEELKNYFDRFEDRYYCEKDGNTYRRVFFGFLDKNFEYKFKVQKRITKNDELLIFGETNSLLDKMYEDCPAQYATDKETPQTKWNEVTTTLKDIDTSQVHYVKLPENHIVIDFDIPDKDGNKSLYENIKEASKFPKTYAELSKSGQGIHLHYIYAGDVSKLSRVYADHIEIKVFTGKSSLRRKLTKCNDTLIATISSGLPLKGEKMVNFDSIQSEKHLRSLISKGLNKEVWSATKPSIDYINKVLTDAYESGISYDVTDMRNAVFAFAAGSSHQADYCIKLVNKMPFKSKEVGESQDAVVDKVVFFDTEVFPNLFLVCYKFANPEHPGEGEIFRLVNPTPAEITNLIRHKLIGFNNRNYDNHLLHACIMGYTPEMLWRLSQKIISGKKGSKEGKFGEAYNYSYTDILDFSSVKQSLKKFEIDCGIHHQELGMDWNEPVPEEKWDLVADYCENDVRATEVVFYSKGRQADFSARQILADISQLTVNDSTNSNTTKLIFNGERKPQSKFNYYFMGDDELISDALANNNYGYLDEFKAKYPNVNLNYTVFGKDGRALFPTYDFDKTKRESTYRDEIVGEGGYVYSEPGMYGNVGLLDVASMHPHSIIAAPRLFGPYTDAFEDLVKARILIKHKEFDKAKKLFGGKLAPYLNDESTAKALAGALKIAINSVYGLTKAGFDHPFKDPRNIDNYVAKRGALFMVNLKHLVQEQGFIVAHIKTDSIKIPDATPEIIQLVNDYGKLYGYTFEHEATYEKMTLIDKAQYVAKYQAADICEKLYGYVPGDCFDHGGQWTSTGTEFIEPYTFKALFTHEPFVFDDYCMVASVKEGLIYLDFNESMPDVTGFEKEFKKAEKDFRDGKLSDTTFEQITKNLQAEIDKGHNYKFVGRVGQFVPVLPGKNGALLMTLNKGSYSYVAGSKGYRWMDAEVIMNYPDVMDYVDISYFQALVDKAAADISKFGDLEWFLNGDYSHPPFAGTGILNHPQYLDETPYFDEK